MVMLFLIHTYSKKQNHVSPQCCILAKYISLSQNDRIISRLNFVWHKHPSSYWNCAHLSQKLILRNHFLLCNWRQCKVKKNIQFHLSRVKLFLSTVPDPPRVQECFVHSKPSLKPQHSHSRGLGRKCRRIAQVSQCWCLHWMCSNLK